MARLLADPVEKCREGALTFFASAAEHLPDPAALLSCLMPAMTDRMGEVPVIEPSEELRLAITQLVAGPVIQHSGSGLLPYLTLVVKVVCRALEDPFHDIKKVTQLAALPLLFYIFGHPIGRTKGCSVAHWQSGKSRFLSTLNKHLVLQAACNAITNLCKRLPGDNIRSQHDAILPSLLPNLSHQHSRVRASSLAALDTLVIKVCGCWCAVVGLLYRYQGRPYPSYLMLDDSWVPVTLCAGCE